jgi:hypothetical protein
MTKKHRRQFAPQQSPAQKPVIQELKPIIREPAKAPGHRTLKENVKEYWPLMLVGLFIIAIVIYAIVPRVVDMFDPSYTLVGNVVAVSEESVSFQKVVGDNRTLRFLEPYLEEDTYTIDLGDYNHYFTTGFRYKVSWHYRGGKMHIFYAQESRE